ncbi:uncharacterized protein LOC141639535 [Silene latifolia]|uniref:uncharacterized protein LOC141639535 n=1 Tax=Silene latifolia TaxID=37657 RepID=UPI003D77174E
MVNRIRSLGAKKLSYAGRVVLINYVLNTLYSYWASIFLKPKGVIRRIEAICRNYLWGSSSDYHKVPLIAWEKVTLPKDEGGLGIKRAVLWNTDTVAKLVDWIYGKADRLWIRWVNQIYIKNKDWHNYCPPTDASWAWKCICRVKDIMKLTYIDDQWPEDPKGYSIRSGYEWLRPRQTIQRWKNIVWNKWNYPKHAMISWITMNNGLKVKDKLYQIRCSPDNRYCISDVAPETQSHLFFECSYSKQILLEIEKSCGFKVAGHNSRMNLHLIKPGIVADSIREEVKRRIRTNLSKEPTQNDKIWLRKWGMAVD